MRLSDFLRTNTEEILSEWETFARAIPSGESMDIAALRDHAKEMLLVIARDLDAPQTDREQEDKGKGESDAGERTKNNAAQEHGAGRAGSGFSISEMVSEFRALRASVMRLWSKQQGDVGKAHLEYVTRFNEAIDQAIAESLTQYTHDIGQSKERFLAILGHDLRTPLGAIITSTSFLRDSGELPEPQRTLVGRISSAARRMNQMVADLLEFTRTRFGDSIPIVRKDMDAGTMLRDVVAEVAASYPSCTVKLDASGDLRGQWDSDRLTQAMTNLLGNAVEHGSKAPIEVVARDAANKILIAVKNHGEAIPKEQLGSIFDAMTQGGPESTRDRRHLGLGLYIVEKIVTAHGGTVDVTSSQEQGTTFTVRLPRATT